jgi:hypothetical protein
VHIFGSVRKFRKTQRRLARSFKKQSRRVIIGRKAMISTGANCRRCGFLFPGTPNDATVTVAGRPGSADGGTTGPSGLGYDASIELR